MSHDSPRQYGLGAAREPAGRVVNWGEAFSVEVYITRLQQELRDKAASTNQTGATILSAAEVIRQLQRLRWHLSEEHLHGCDGGTARS